MSIGLIWFKKKFSVRVSRTHGLCMKVEEFVVYLRYNQGTICKLSVFLFRTNVMKTAVYLTRCKDRVLTEE
jgi:hypothetical protein